MRDEQRILDRALAFHDKGNIADAARLYRRIINANPNHLQALHFLGVAEAATGNIDHAKSLLDRSLQSNPVNLQFVENYAAVLHRAREHDAVIRLCQHFNQIAPTNLALLHAGAAALLAQERHSEAIDQLKQLLAHHPDHVPAHFMLGSALAKTGQHDAALASYDRALALNPQLAEGHLDKGTIHFAHRRYREALLAYDHALTAQPGLAEAWLGRCYTLIQLGRHDEALTAAEEAHSVRPDFADAWIGRGNALFGLDRFDEAAAAYDRALAIRPDRATAWSGHGNIFLRTSQHEEAERAFDRALAADSACTEAWLGRGILLLSLGRHDEATTAIDRALALNKSLPNAWLARGQVSYLGKRYDDALAEWNRSLDLDPDQPAVAAACLRVRMHMCDWTGFTAACDFVGSSIRSGQLVAPFMLVAIPSAADEQRRCAERWIMHNFRSVRGPVWRGERYEHDRVRIAYLSADYHDHATSHLMAGVFEHHDRSGFEVTGISVGPNDNSEMRRRVEQAFEHFVDASALGDDEIANLVRAREIDILIDLKGYTQNARTGVLAMRPAPIQVNYLGFPGTLGADFMDYIIADRHLIQEDERGCYTEKTVWLPDSYQANDRARPVPEAVPARTAHGLPADAFVFCCFNDNYKITPDVFSGWMRILQAVNDGVFWLFEDTPTAANNLRREAAARGVDPERLVFARRLPSAEHLARHRCADLFLDTLPYGAHTTASDALWMGLPFVTRLGETFAGRVGASLLNAVGLPELVTMTQDTYEQLAIELATNRTRLTTLKAKLARNRLTTPLFDTTGFTHHLEAGYAAMLERHRAGLPADHMQISRLTAAEIAARP